MPEFHEDLDHEYDCTYECDLGLNSYSLKILDGCILRLDEDNIEIINIHNSRDRIIGRIYLYDADEPEVMYN
jgi:hypothetical protein